MTIVTGAMHTRADAIAELGASIRPRASVP
jgi:hypothetical protein